MGEGLLQQHIAENGCTVLNYSGNKITVDIFYSQEMYEKFLGGLDCRQGMGLYDSSEKLDFHQLPDGKTVVVQKDGKHVKAYRFFTIFKATMNYKERLASGKLVTRSLVFQIRKNKFSNELNLVIGDGKIPFSNLYEIKKFLEEKYGSYMLTNDWSVYYERNDSDRPRNTKLSG